LGNAENPGIRSQPPSFFRCAIRTVEIDLHNHSPASYDFRGNKDTALDDAIAQLKAKPVDVVMFTDHHTLPNAEFVEQLSTHSGRTVLRGAELNVFVDAWSKPSSKIEKQVFFHLLIGFDPDEDADYRFKDLKRRCKDETRNISGTTIPGLTAPIPDICDMQFIHDSLQRVLEIVSGQIKPDQTH